MAFQYVTVNSNGMSTHYHARSLSLLVEKSRGTWLQYTKEKLSPVYLKGKCRKQIIEALPKELGMK